MRRPNHIERRDEQHGNFIAELSQRSADQSRVRVDLFCSGSAQTANGFPGKVRLGTVLRVSVGGSAHFRPAMSRKP